MNKFVWLDSKRGVRPHIDAVDLADALEESMQNAVRRMGDTTQGSTAEAVVSGEVRAFAHLYAIARTSLRDAYADLEEDDLDWGDGDDITFDPDFDPGDIVTGGPWRNGGRGGSSGVVRHVDFRNRNGDGDAS